MSRAGGKYSDRRRNKTCVCAFCRNVFYATRSDAKTCSDAHRKALSRLDMEGVTKVVERREIPIKTRGQVVSTAQIETADFFGRLFAKVTS